MTIKPVCVRRAMHSLTCGSSLALAAALLLVGDFASAATPNTTISGERIPVSAFGPGILESMEVVVERDRAMREKNLASSQSHPKSNPERRFGEWVIPNRRGSTSAHSGRHYITNEWGDTRMGIGFPESVDVHGFFVAGQMASGVWPGGMRVIGFANGKEIAATEWFRNLAEKPAWFDVDLCDVDRIVIEVEAAVQGGGWYAIDDLTYSPKADADRSRTVVDFDDLDYAMRLTGTDYAGLTWEFGTGFDHQNIVPAPRMPDELTDKPQPGEMPPGGATQGGIAGGGGTLPMLLGQFQTVVRGDANQFSFPPDTCGAVGSEHFVVAVNRVFAVYDKETGAELINVSLGAFQPGTGGDPRVVYDHYADRWVLISTDFSNTETIFLAVSQSDDATGVWFKTSFAADQDADAGRWPDYPTLGYDQNGYYIGAYMVPSSMSIFAIDKEPLIDSSQSLGAVTAFRNLNYENALQPAIAYDNPPGGYFVSTPSSGNIRVRRVNPPLNNPTLTELGFISVPAYSSPPDAPAQGSATPISTIDRRLMMATYRDGSIWTTHTINVNGRAACRWYELDVASMATVQIGTVSSGSFHYYFPSIMVNKFGQAAMGFSGSNANTFVNAYYTGRKAQDPPGIMASPEIFRFGLAAQNNIDNVGRNRWGDYSLTTLDPVDQSSFYSLQEFALQNDIWATEVAIIDGGDCNASLVPDECDVSCGEPGGECDVPGCGQSADCNGNNFPDECEQVVGACCLADGSCCDYTSESQCISNFGTFNGSETDCEMLRGICEPAVAPFVLDVDTSQAYPGGKIEVEVGLESLSNLANYQVTLAMNVISGTDAPYLDCSGCTGAPFEPACATRIDEDRADYVFAGQPALIAAVSCEGDALGSFIFSGGVDLTSEEAYAGEFTFTVPETASPGDQFELVVVGGIESTTLQQPSGTYIPYQPGNSVPITLVEAPLCETPVLIADGSRALLATPTIDFPQALLVSGDPGDPDVSCFSLYVQADGTLGPNPVYRTAVQWGTASIRGEEIIPSKTYIVQSDCGSPGNPELSGPVAATTWTWGDVASPPNDTVNFADIQLVVQAFQENFANVTLERADLEPCLPNRVANFADVLRDVQAFQGQSYPETGCPLPCP